MTEHYGYEPRVEYPSLFFEVSQGLLYYAGCYQLNSTRSELVFMRREALGDLERMGITQESYLPSDHQFIMLEALFIQINDFYGATHSFADLP